MNQIHKGSPDAEVFREMLSGIDQAVAAAYGWDDLDLGHDFHETDQGTRYTLSPPARREVLDRLLEHNHQRYAEEVAQGLHDKKNKKKAAKKKAAKKKSTARKAAPDGQHDTDDTGDQSGLFDD